MGCSGHHWCIAALTTLLSVFASRGMGADVYLDWFVSFNSNIMPVGVNQSVITINDLFPGPLVNVTTNDVVHVNVHNNLDEPLLFTWNGIQQRQNSWQDGVAGTNCPIQPGMNWTYVFQVKDQIGSFIYFPSTNFLKAAGGFGPIRVNNRVVIPVPFGTPDGDFDLLIGDWSSKSYKEIRTVDSKKWNINTILMNGKPPYNEDNKANSNYESITVVQGKTYRFRISNVGTSMSFNFRIQNHKLKIAEAEGAYTNMQDLDSLDVHVGQSYSVLVKADQNDSSSYYMVATPTQVNSSVFGLGVLHYEGSTAPPAGSYPAGPNATDPTFSVNQANMLRLNLTAGAARENPQGSFNLNGVTPNQTFVLNTSVALIEGYLSYTINNVSFRTSETPFNLADHHHEGAKVYDLDAMPTASVNKVAVKKTSVLTGKYKNWLQIVLKNDMDTMDSWHLDGYSFFVVGFGKGDWNPGLNKSYNTHDPLVRSTVQVYPGMWTAVYVYLDNPGIWNLRSQLLENWYLGQETYIKVSDPNSEDAPPDNLLQCGIYKKDTPSKSGCSREKANLSLLGGVFVTLAVWFIL